MGHQLQVSGNIFLDFAAIYRYLAVNIANILWYLINFGRGQLIKFFLKNTHRNAFATLFTVLDNSGWTVPVFKCNFSLLKRKKVSLAECNAHK
jgi:hypothetical protein